MGFVQKKTMVWLHETEILEALPIIKGEKHTKILLSKQAKISVMH